MTFSTVNVFAGGNASSSVSPSYVATVALSSDAFKIIFRVDCRCSINDGHPRLSIATSTLPASAACTCVCTPSVIGGRRDGGAAATISAARRFAAPLLRVAPPPTPPSAA